ncbi:MAG: hypothetical protein JO307_30275 [Bryobacterales bacterium]|nr:hypothetical protein [Bryobacterales bacterium]MBV9401129.1 hypothetical protein [Bryobacterales bacterium]
MRCWLLLAMAPVLSAQRWTLQYFFDEAKARLTIADLAFPNAQRGIAVGWTEEGEHKPKPVALVTSDEGAHWTVIPLQDLPRSVFFLNDSQGWMVSEDGIWFTEESGRSWRKISEQLKPDKKLKPSPPGGLILKVWFNDAQHGYGVGYQKTVVQTSDGGHTWTPVPDAAKPTGNPVFTGYSQIAFDGPLGIIAGAAIPPRRDLGPLPTWMDPERATKARQVPTLTLTLQTRDAGGHWTPDNAPLIGFVSALRIAAPDALYVFSYNASFQFPSEVFHSDFRTGESTSAFHQADRRVTDIALFPGPVAFLAAVEPPGRLNTVPIPGRVKMLTSTNLKEWKEMPVDYRAEATTLTLAGPDPKHVWAATDTGMILHLTE